MSQVKTCKFSFLKHSGDSTYEELFSPVRCKDYLEDLLLAKITGCKMKDDIYGFRYDGELSISPHAYLSVHLGNPDQVKRVINSLPILHKYESSDITVSSLLEDDETTIMLRVPSFWLRSPLLLSTYTFMIRCFTYNKDISSNWRDLFDQVELSGGNDSDYVRRFMKHCDLDKLLLNIDEVLGDHPLTGYSDESMSQAMFDYTHYKCEMGFSMYSLHDTCGFKSLSELINRLYDGEPSVFKGGSFWGHSYYEILERS